MRWRYVYGWSHGFEGRSASNHWPHRRTTDGFSSRRVYASLPPLSLLAFSRPAYHRVPRQRKTEPRACLSYLLKFDSNYRSDCYKLLYVKTIEVTYTRDVISPHPKAPLIVPLNAIKCQPTALLEDTYAHGPVIIAPDFSPAPALALARPPLHQICSRAKPIIKTGLLPYIQLPKPVALIIPYTSRELQHERYRQMPGRTRGRSRAMRNASPEYEHH